MGLKNDLDMEFKFDPDENKISVEQYIKDHSLLTVAYIPFDEKLEIVSHILAGVINTVGGINTSLLRRVATETFITNITNIDMSVVDYVGYNGYDQLCENNELENLKQLIGSEYEEFEKILSERVSDYIRIETNPALTINKIYEQITTVVNTAMERISNIIQDVDVEKLTEQLSTFIPKEAGDSE